MLTNYRYLTFNNNIAGKNTFTLCICIKRMQLYNCYFVLSGIRQYLEASSN